ncbi:MAG: glycosyltransferase family 2 protein [Trueperaceae bacterium]
MTADPELSVLTPTSGRVDLVLRKLEALAADAERPALEVVLLDNACPDGVGDRVAARDWPFEVRVLRSRERLPAGPARLMAGRAARGRLVWLSDDDCVPHAGAAALHLARQALGRCVGVGSVRFVADDGRFLSALRARRPGPARVTGVNTVVERATWLRVAERLPPLPRRYGGEDTLLGLALEDVGARIAPVPDAWVDHVGPIPSSSGDPAKGYDAGYNAAVLAAAYPRAAWALGVHPLQLRAKGALLAPPLGSLARRSAPRLTAFEAAYLEGAIDGRAAPRLATPTAIPQEDPQ